MKKTDIVILAGGKGTRIKKYLNGYPKPLVKIKNYRFLDLLIKKICRYNINNLIILAGYKGNLIKKKYHNKSFNFVKTQVIIEKKPLGTGGALAQLEDRIKNDFIVINGDTFFDLDLSKVIRFQLDKNEIFLSLVKNHNYKSNKKLVYLSLDKNRNVISNNNSKFINGGVYKFNKSFLKTIKKKNCSLENDIIPNLIDQNKVKGLKFNNFFIDIGTPKNLATAKRDLINYLMKPALFLDRDNTIIHDSGYVHQINHLKFKSSFIKILKQISKKNIYIFIITNQSGIGRGYFSEKSFEKFQFHLKKKLSNYNIYIDDVRFCPYHIDSRIKKYKKKSNFRKPGNGMILDLFKNWPIKRRSSIMIGDQISDKVCAEKSKITFNFANDVDLKNLNRKFN